MKYFFYDESEYRRRLTKDILSADNFVENFVANIVVYWKKLVLQFGIILPRVICFEMN
ncbi:hypothetical protein SAMN02745941_01195 [Clostridium intestinale DSM 6191]|uniref:Uncharacterized protein n=2 Tax=Clostridium intestinale TaxID=36845 RepID=A0A1M5WQB5_9CLOT|nr:hypothetical protein SAMN02745941_01195 [Clostridium intestinale DSM 6191]